MQLKESPSILWLLMTCDGHRSAEELLSQYLQFKWARWYKPARNESFQMIQDSHTHTLLFDDGL